jgi:hypothetical protein
LHQGAIFTSSKHLLALPWQKNIVLVHCLDLVSWQVRHKRQLVASFAMAENVSAMH